MVQTSEGIWQDDDFDAAKDKPLAIAFGSDTYFRILRLYPAALPFAQLGEKVVFKLGEHFVSIEAGGDTLDDAALRRLFG